MNTFSKSTADICHYFDHWGTLNNLVTQVPIIKSLFSQCNPDQYKDFAAFSVDQRGKKVKGSSCSQSFTTPRTLQLFPK